MTGIANIVAPAAVAKGFSPGNGAVAFPAAAITAVGHDATGENILTYTLASPALAAYGGANSALALPPPALTVAAKFTALGTAALKMSVAVVAGTGTASAVGRAALTFGTTSATYKAVGYSGAVVSITLTGSPTITATGTTGSTGTALLTLPLFELVASGTLRNYGGAELLMPAAYLVPTARGYLAAPSAMLVAIGSATVAAVYEAYAVNLNHKPRRGVDPVDEATHYTSYPFDRIVRYKNSYFGMNSTGLYLLEGTTDAGTAIPWEVKTAITDFGNAQNKTVEMAYFGGRMGPAATVSLHVGEAAPQVYSYTTPRGALAQNYRQPFGRGLKARYFALSASGSSELTLDSLTLNIATLARKV